MLHQYPLHDRCLWDRGLSVVPPVSCKSLAEPCSDCCGPALLSLDDEVAPRPPRVALFRPTSISSRARLTAPSAAHFPLQDHAGRRVSRQTKLANLPSRKSLTQDILGESNARLRRNKENYSVVSVAG